MAPHQILRDTVYMKPITMISTSEEMEYVASLEVRNMLSSSRYASA